MAAVTDVATHALSDGGHHNNKQADDVMTSAYTCQVTDENMRPLGTPALALVTCGAAAGTGKERLTNFALCCARADGLLPTVICLHARPSQRPYVQPDCTVFRTGL